MGGCIVGDSEIVVGGKNSDCGLFSSGFPSVSSRGGIV